MTAEQYYKKYIMRKIGENKCKTCGRKTTLINIDRGFHSYCSSKCSNRNPTKKAKVEKSCLKKYGVKNVFQSDSIKRKSLKTIREKFGCANISSLQEVKDKKIATLIKNYGKNYGQILKNQRIKTCRSKYGKAYYNQTDDGICRSINTSFKKKKYILPSGRVIYKQGYEPNFLDYVFGKGLFKEKDIEYNPKGIKYRAVDNKFRYYFPDFLIKSLNMIVECKSSWTMKTDKNVVNKEKAAKRQGYRYVRIVNNNFTFFESYKFEKILAA